MTGASSTIPDPADALARGLAQHVLRWSLARAAPPAAAQAAAIAAQALSLATGDGHVCVWLADLPALTAALPHPVGAPGTAPPSTAGAWRSMLLASQVVATVVGTAAVPAGQPLVLDGDGRLYLHRHFDLERRLARRLLQGAAPWPADPQADLATAAQLAALFGASPDAQPDWQKLAAALALQGRLTVISGGPGTGKTTTVVNLLACLLAREPETRVVLAAPTGKAAARLAEALRERAGHLDTALRSRLPASATTVHRLLGVRPGRGGLAGAGEQAFLHSAANPLALDLLVLDEASMLDLALATRLLEAVPLQARIVLLGDKDQLAAVESGAVFAELSADPALSAATTARLASLCGLPAGQIQPPAATQAGALRDSVVWFQRNFRFARESGIGRLAADALAGQASAVQATLRAASGAELAWLDDAGSQPAQATLAAMLAGYDAYVAACRAALAGAPADADLASAAQRAHLAFGRFRVLCALRAGPRGVQSVNQWLGRHLRLAITGEAGQAHLPWFAGRPVMVLRNDPALRLFNGDIGLTLPGPDGALRVLFPADDGHWRAVAPARLPAHESAWAMTVHKSQGSEFDAVLLLLPARHSRVLSRELLYTGITRARRQLTLAAGAGVLATAVQASSQRHAGLQARLREAVAEAARAAR
jgi:exodeoxyribonuclease V alpha subunit